MVIREVSWQVWRHHHHCLTLTFASAWQKRHIMNTTMLLLVDFLLLSLFLLLVPCCRCCCVAVVVVVNVVATVADLLSDIFPDILFCCLENGTLTTQNEQRNERKCTDLWTGYTKRYCRDSSTVKKTVRCGWWMVRGDTYQFSVSFMSYVLCLAVKDQGCLKHRTGFDLYG